MVVKTEGAAVAKQRDHAVKLTFRQKSFLSKVADVYRGMDVPLHYTAIADKLGLSKSTVYDMFRVLEQKGMIESQYVTPKEVAGPGRASVLFYPTARAKELFFHVAGEVKDEWEVLKARILTSLRQGKTGNYKGVIQELLNKAGEAQAPLEQCAEIVTALLLSLREANYKLTEKGSLSAIIKAPVSKLRMSILAGLVLGISLSNQAVERLLGNYRGYTDKYEASLRKLNKEGLLKLHKFTREVWSVIQS
jgi:DNA-binding MarR family transcriptional regulator